MQAETDIIAEHRSGDGPGSSEDDRRVGDGHRERRDVVSGEVRAESALIRIALGPEDALYPDVNAKLPGRGAWVAADRASVETALKTKAFNRSFKRQVKAPDDLADQIETLLKRRALGLISMGMKGGRIVQGFDQVRGLSRTAPIAWRIEARDGSPDGRSKIRTLAKAVSRELGRPLPKMVGVFTADELGQALGRDHSVHVAIPHGPLAKHFGAIMTKLAGFTDLVPEDWPDREHEEIISGADADVMRQPPSTPRRESDEPETPDDVTDDTTDETDETPDETT